MILYRYRKFHEKYLCDEIEDGKLFFCRLDSFNDPYEGRLTVDLDVNSITFYEILKLLRSIKPSDSRDTEMLELSFGKYAILISRMNELIQTMSDAELKRTADQMTVASPGGSMNGILNDFHDGLRTQTVVCCFTEQKNSAPMFAYYAGDHNGVCIEYETTETAHELYKVTYSNNIPLIDSNQLGEGIDKMFKDYALTKSTFWQHEREWRIVYHPAPEIALITHGMRINHVTIGLKIEKENSEKIVNWCKNSIYHNVQCSKVSLSPNTYELKSENLL